MTFRATVSWKGVTRVRRRESGEIRDSVEFPRDELRHAALSRVLTSRDYGVRVNGRLNYAFAPRALPACVSRLISYLYIPSGRELVSMIKKAPGERRKFRAEYLTLSESELCLGSGRRSDEEADGRGGEGVNG